MIRAVVGSGGTVLIDNDGTPCGPVPALYVGIMRFDVFEYFRYWHEDPGCVEQFDILDLGYWMETGDYEEPCHDWRADYKEQLRGFNVIR